MCSREGVWIVDDIGHYQPGAQFARRGRKGRRTGKFKRGRKGEMQGVRNSDIQVRTSKGSLTAFG